MLAAYGIPTVETRVAATATSGGRRESLGYPVVLKLHSETITHKTDVGGVPQSGDCSRGSPRYDTIRDGDGQSGASISGRHGAAMVSRDGYELIVGSSSTRSSGRCSCSVGRQAGRGLQDRALALPPLNTTLARRMMERTKIFVALQGVRGGAPVDLAALDQLLVRFSQLSSNSAGSRRSTSTRCWPRRSDWSRSMPASCSTTPTLPEDALPTLAIRPYPVQYVGRWTLKNGTEVTIRPIRPEDEPMMARFHQTLSEQSVYFRYLHLIGLSQRIAHERLTRVCFIDYAREMALVAEQRDAAGPAGDPRRRPPDEAARARTRRSSPFSSPTPSSVRDSAPSFSAGSCRSDATRSSRASSPASMWTTATCDSSASASDSPSRTTARTADESAPRLVSPSPPRTVQRTGASQR